MTQPDWQPEAQAEFDQQSPVAHVETDRFCDQCGYNLRTQPVRRDPRTAVLLCRCPECGRFHPARDNATAGRLWLRRLATLLLSAWILTIMVGGLSLGGAQVGLSYATLDELTRYERVTTQVVTTTQGRITISPSTGRRPWKLVVRENSDDYYYTFVVPMYCLSLVAGLVLALLAVVVLHHWPRWTYLIPVLLVPIIAGLIVWLVWREEAPGLLDWSTPYILTQAAANLAGGLAGILFGRPLARLIVTLALPSRPRQVLAFLWLVDGKEPPGTRR